MRRPEAAHQSGTEDGLDLAHRPRYPEVDGKQFPWSIAYEPTEPLLGITRKVVPPLSGVDISPIVWVGIISFLNEVLLGPQGLLSLIQREGGL